MVCNQYDASRGVRKDASALVRQEAYCTQNDRYDMHLDQFELRTATFEVRYDRNVALWDRSGLFWSSWFAKYPDLKIATAAPNEVVAQNRTFRAVAGLERANVIALKPGNSGIKDLTEAGTHLVHLLSEVLGVSVYTRLGFRTIFRRRFADKNQAADAVHALGLMRIPSTEIFGIKDGVALQPEYSVRLEGSDIGVLTRLKVQELTISKETPPEIEEAEDQSSTQTYHEMIFDLDYYTTKQVLVSQLRAKDWLESAFHAIRRDSHTFLGGELG